MNRKLNLTAEGSSDRELSDSADSRWCCCCDCGADGFSSNEYWSSSYRVLLSYRALLSNFQGWLYLV